MWHMFSQCHIQKLIKKETLVTTREGLKAKLSAMLDLLFNVD